MSWQVVELEVRHIAPDESSALRWAAGKYRLTADELATLAAERDVTITRLGVVVGLRRTRGAR